MPIEIESPEQLGYGNIRCNLAESSVTDLRLEELDLDIDKLVLAYGDHYGKPELRELIAAKYPGITSQDVLITAGAANALFIVATSLLSKNDHVVAEFPNYSTNLETPRMLGCNLSTIELKFEDEFRLNVTKLKKLVTKQTKLISVTTPHNPTGAAINEIELRELIRNAEENNSILVVDETYRDLSFEELPALAASLSENAISISSLSKACGLPGIRIGWIVTKNRKLREQFLAAKEQILLSNSVLDEEVATRFMMEEKMWLAKMKVAVDGKFRIVEDWMKAHEHLEWIRPVGGVVCFPRFRNRDAIDVQKFYRTLNDEYATLVGSGRWFGMDEYYMRIGYGWPSEKELKDGLDNIDCAIAASVRK